MPKDEYRTVYTTEKGYVDNRDARRENKRNDKKRRKQQNQTGPIDPKDGVIRVRRETSGRGGKTVTTVTGLTGDVKTIAKRLKAACGTGGAVKNGIVEIQGNHVDTVVAKLEAEGLTVKRAGG